MLKPLQVDKAWLALQAWTNARTMYLGNVLSKMLRGYTDAAISLTSGLLTAFSKFAVQVSAASNLTSGVNGVLIA